MGDEVIAIGIVVVSLLSIIALKYRSIAIKYRNFALEYRNLFRKYKQFYEDIINPPKPVGLTQAEKAQNEKERWMYIRSQILLRDSFRCQECNYYKHLEVHHIIPKSKDGSDKPENLITLCQRCHAKRHGFKNRENRHFRHKKRNHRKKFKRYVNGHHRELRRMDYPVQSIEDIHPRQENLSPEAVAKRQSNYEKWKRNGLNQPS